MRSTDASVFVAKNWNMVSMQRALMSSQSKNPSAYAAWEDWGMIMMMALNEKQQITWYPVCTYGVPHAIDRALAPAMATKPVCKGNAIQRSYVPHPTLSIH